MTLRAHSSESSLLCSEPGCTRRWTSNFGRRWCGEHNPGLNGHNPAQRQSSLPSMPSLREAVRPYSEPDEPDEEYVHDDRA